MTTNFEHTVTDLPEENQYPKLVRDKIPDIILEETGREVPIEVLDDVSFEERLRQKVIEEAAELAAADSGPHLLEEIVDVRELLEELERLKGFTPEQVKAIQDEKREKRGGFGGRVLMINNE